MDIDGKIVVLTGATGGIGRAIAAAVASRGGKLILVARNPDKLQALCATLPGDGHVVVAADITTVQGREQVVASSGDISMLINNAGVNHFGLLGQQSETQLRQMLELNTLAPILLTQSLLPLLTRRESHIVNIGSGFGSIGFAGYTGYCASKFAIEGITRSLAIELGSHNIRVNSVCPTFIATPLTQKTLADPDRVAWIKSKIKLGRIGEIEDVIKSLPEDLRALWD